VNEAHQSTLVFCGANAVTNFGNALKAEPFSPWGGTDVIRPGPDRDLMLAVDT
jgi:hypothetical protein